MSVVNHAFKHKDNIIINWSEKQR